MGLWAEPQEAGEDCKVVPQNQWTITNFKQNISIFSNFEWKMSFFENLIYSRILAKIGKLAQNIEKLRAMFAAAVWGVKPGSYRIFKKI